MLKLGKRGILKLDLVYNAWKENNVSELMRWSLINTILSSHSNRISNFDDAVHRAYDDAPV